MKSQEANQIIADPSATGERLTKAEKLSAELPAIERRIDERTAELQRIAQIKGSLSQSSQWAGEPQRMPFVTSGAVPPGHMAGKSGEPGVNQFRVAGWEDAGTSTFAYSEQQKRWEMVNEAGAGIVNNNGKKVWDLLSTFEYKRDFAMYVRRGIKHLDLSTKTLQEGLDDQGGVFAPAELIARVIGRLPAPTKLRGLVTTLTTGRDTLILPRKQYSADDIYTTAFRVTWTGEIPYDGTGNVENVNDSNLLGNIDIPVHTAMLAAPVTRNLIEDSAFPIQAWLEAELAQTIDITYEDMIVNGSTANATTQGADRPAARDPLRRGASGNTEGNQFPEVILTSTAAGIDYGSLIDMQTALAPQYENDSTRWVFNKKSTYRALNKLVDAQNRPLFTTGYEDSGLVRQRGRILLGDECILSQLMPSISSTNFPMIYGDLRGYFLAQRVGFSIQVLDQTRAKLNQVELVGRIRFGGRPIEPWRLKVLKSNNT